MDNTRVSACTTIHFQPSDNFIVLAAVSGKNLTEYADFRALLPLRFPNANDRASHRWTMEGAPAPTTRCVRRVLRKFARRGTWRSVCGGRTSAGPGLAADAGPRRHAAQPLRDVEDRRAGGTGAARRARLAELAPERHGFWHSICGRASAGLAAEKCARHIDSRCAGDATWRRAAGRWHWRPSPHCGPEPSRTRPTLWATRGRSGLTDARAMTLGNDEPRRAAQHQQLLTDGDCAMGTGGGRTPSSLVRVP
jgi:hypothetical protein